MEGFSAYSDQWFVVGSYCKWPTIQVCMVALDPMDHCQHFSLNVAISRLTVR